MSTRENQLAAQSLLRCMPAPKPNESPRMLMWRRLADQYPRSHCCQAPLIVQSGAGVYCDHCGQPRLA